MKSFDPDYPITPGVLLFFTSVTFIFGLLFGVSLCEENMTDYHISDSYYEFAP